MRFWPNVKIDPKDPYWLRVQNLKEHCFNFRSVLNILNIISFSESVFNSNKFIVKYANPNEALSITFEEGKRGSKLTRTAR